MYKIQFLPMEDLSEAASDRLDIKDLNGSTTNEDWITWLGDKTKEVIIDELVLILNTAPISIKNNYFRVIYEEETN